MNVIVHEVYRDEFPQAHGAILTSDDIKNNQTVSKWLNNVIYAKYFNDNDQVTLDENNNIIKISDEYYQEIVDAYNEKEKGYLQKPGYRTDEYIIIPFDEDL